MENIALLLLKWKLCKTHACMLRHFSHGCYSWTLKKAEHWRIDAFKLWCWRRLLKIPWIARSLNQSILKEINSEYSLKGLTLKLKVQYFGHLMLNQLTGKDPDAGKEWKQKKGETGDEMIQYHHWLNGHEFEQAPGNSEGQGSLACCSSWGHKESDTTATEQQPQEQ